jgi:hypothetical protein
MLIGICFIVGTLIFGSNPLREFQNKQRELLAKYGSDELTIATNLFIEQQQGAGNTGVFSEGVAVDPNSKVAILNSMKSSASSNSVSSSDLASDSVVKVAKPDDDLPEDNFIGVEVKSNTSANVAKMEKISNYYPPIVGQAEVVVPQRETVVFTGKEPKLRSGQVIAFEGVYVYLVDDYGNRKIMPDGTYNLMDGNLIVVNNGRNMLLR